MSATRNTCDKCRHYTPTDRPERDHDGRCARVGYAGDGPTPVNGCMAWDAESYNAGLYVGPKFGCIHWVRREPTNGN